MDADGDSRFEIVAIGNPASKLFEGKKCKIVVSIECLTKDE